MLSCELQPHNSPPAGRSQLFGLFLARSAAVTLVSLRNPDDQRLRHFHERGEAEGFNKAGSRQGNEQIVGVICLASGSPQAQGVSDSHQQVFFQNRRFKTPGKLSLIFFYFFFTFYIHPLSSLQLTPPHSYSDCSNSKIWFISPLPPHA